MSNADSYCDDDYDEPRHPRDDRRLYLLEEMRDFPDRFQNMMERVAEYIEQYGNTEEVREEARFALGFPCDLFDGLLAYYEESRIQSLLNNLRAHESQVKTLRSALRAYLDKPGEAQ